MYFEIIGFIAAISLLCFIFAEWKNKHVLGAIGGMILFLLGLLILSEGISIKTGELNTFYLTNNGLQLGNGNLNGLSTFSNITNSTSYSEKTNITTNMTSLSNELENTTYIYSKVSWTSFANFDWLGLVVLLIGLYAMFHYILGGI